MPRSEGHDIYMDSVGPKRWLTHVFGEPFQGVGGDLSGHVSRPGGVFGGYGATPCGAGIRMLPSLVGWRP